MLDGPSGRGTQSPRRRPRPQRRTRHVGAANIAASVVAQTVRSVAHPQPRRAAPKPTGVFRQPIGTVGPTGPQGHAQRRHAANRAEKAVRKVPGRARPPIVPKLARYTPAQRANIVRRVNRYGQKAARDRGYRSPGDASAHGVDLAAQIVRGGGRPARAVRQYATITRQNKVRTDASYVRQAIRAQPKGPKPDALTSLADYLHPPLTTRQLAKLRPQFDPHHGQTIKPGRGKNTHGGGLTLGTILSGGIHPVAGMSIADVAGAVNKGFVSPAIKGTLDLAANTPGALYNVAAAGAEAVTGDTSRAKRLAHDFVNHDPIALLVQGRGKEALNAFAANPVAGTLEVLGAKGAVGRGVGRVQRAAGASREAAPAVLEGTKIVIRRPYSKDAITRKRQIVVDRQRTKRAQAYTQKAVQAERQGAHDTAIEFTHKARAMSPIHVTNHEVRRRVDERNHANEQVRRTLRSMAIVRASKHVVATRKGGHLVSLLAQAIVHPHRADIEAYVRELDAQYHSGILTKGQEVANRTTAKQIRNALASKKLDIPALHSAARQYAREQGMIEQHLVRSGLLDAGQAEKARLIPYAVRRMGARHNGDRIIGPNGQFLSSVAIKQHMLAHGVNPDEVAYLSQAPNARGAKNFYKNALQRHTINSPVRTGDATRFGTFDTHPLLLVEQASREANLLAADRGFKGLIDEFALRHQTGHPQAGQVRQFSTKRSADLWIADQHAIGARKLRAVRINPFLGRQRELQSLLDHVNQGAETHPSLLNAQHSAIDGQDGAGPWAVIHDTAAKRIQQHLSLQGPLPGLRGMQVVNQAFRNAVLPLSTKWVTGNVVEAAFRTTLEGAGPTAYLTGRRVLGGERPGIVARPGKRVPRGVGIVRVPGAIDRVASPKVAMETRARTIGGGQFGMAEQTNVHTDATHFEDSRLRPLAHAIGAVARAPVARNVGNLWDRYTHFAFSTNSMLESQFQTALAGKYIREMLPTKGERSTSRIAVEQAARGLTNTNEQVQMGRMIDRAYGKYGKFSPTERAAIAYYTPFIAWSLNAVKFVGSVLPKDHPVATGLFAAAQNASGQWLKDHGLNLWINQAAPGWLQGSAPVGSAGNKVRLGRYLPFGFFGDAGQSVASTILPQYAGAILALNGVSWNGTPLRGPGGGEPTQGDKFSTALEQFFGGTIPVLGQIQQVATKKGPIGQRLNRQFNPFYPVQPTQKATGTSPAALRELQQLRDGAGSDGALRELQRLRGGETKGLTAKFGPDTLVQMAVGEAVKATRKVVRQATPKFTTEGPKHYAAAYQQNRQYAKPGPYQTKLSPRQESAFRQWVRKNKVPFDPHAKTVDYDMRGFYKATGGTWAGGRAHFPDTFKTPYDTTFSSESKYATTNNPFVWRGSKLIDRRTGQVVFAGGG
jgi:hypothetical protein